MKRLFWGTAASLSIACGGRASLLESAGRSGGTQVQAAGGGADHAGASNASGGAGASAGAGGAANSGGATGIAGSAYVPDNPVPFDQLYLEDGSFESSNGYGWDTCATRTPALLTRTQNEASDGTRAFDFNSSGCPTCRDDAPSASQIYLWFTKQPTSAMSLYFDVINVADTTPAGELRFESTNMFCVTLRPLISIPLADLAPERTWQTRCVDLPAFGSDPALGVAVTGASFDVALDAFRLGPPCHAR